jgi:hypothetical protein
LTISIHCHGPMRTAREWLVAIGFAASFALLSGCAGGPGQSLSAADRALVRSAQVGDIKVTQPMSYQAKGAGVGAVFGILGAVAESAARSSAPPDEANSLARAVGPDHALLKEVVKTEFVTAASQRSGIEFVDGPGSAPAARLDLTVNLYGFGRSHLLASQVQPLLNMTATLTGADGRVLWRKSDFVSALSSANAQAYDVERLIQQPELLRAAIRQVTTIVVRNIVDDLPRGPGATTGAAASAPTRTAAAVAASPSAPSAPDANRTQATTAPPAAAAAAAKSDAATQVAATAPLTGSPTTGAPTTGAPTTGSRTSAPLGPVLTFEVTDTFTKNTRTVAVPRDADAGTRILLGDIGAMQPPAGWLPTPAQPGSTWNATFDAPFGADQVRTSLAGVVEGQDRIDTRAGGFDAWRVQVRGTTQRPFSASGSTKSPHEVNLVVWVDRASGQVVRSQSRVTGTMRSAETTELVGSAR